MPARQGGGFAGNLRLGPEYGDRGERPQPQLHSQAPARAAADAVRGVVMWPRR